MAARRATAGRPYEERGGILDEDRISLRQLITLTFAALLSPAIRVFPGRTAQLAGEGGWLAALAALPLALGLCWALSALLKGRGLGRTALDILGPAAGRLVLGLYLAWGLFLLSANARLAALRFLTVSYRNAPLPLFLAAMLALALWLARKPVRVLGRAGEVFYLALAAGLAFSLALGALQTDPGNVLPLWGEDLPAVGAAALPVLGLLGYGVFAAFLAGGTPPEEKGRRRLMRWTAGLCLTLTALQLVCLGNFGPGLTARMDTPFFMMVKGIGIEGTFQRVESVILALWALSDLALLALLASACSAAAGELFALPDRRRAALPVILLALAGALWLFPDAYALKKVMDRAALAGNLAAGFLLPALLLLVKKLRRLP